MTHDTIPRNEFSRSYVWKLKCMEPRRFPLQRSWLNWFGVRPCWQASCSVQLSVTPWTAARQAPLSMGFSRQEYWTGLPVPFPEDLSHPGIELGSPASQADSLLSEPPQEPWETGIPQRDVCFPYPRALPSPQVYYFCSSFSMRRWCTLS